MSRHSIMVVKSTALEVKEPGIALPGGPVVRETRFCIPKHEGDRIKLRWALLK